MKTDDKVYLQTLLIQGILEDRGDDYIIRKPFAVEFPLILDKNLTIPENWTMFCGDTTRFAPSKDKDQRNEN